MMSSMKSSVALEWKFSQVFGERTPGEEIEYGDIISAIDFEKKGKYLAAGDNAGRVVLFEQTDGKDPRSWKELEHSDYPVTWHPEYRFKTEFQSHDPEVDYMMNLEIEGKINKVRWCATPNDSAFILSANDRTIKLWKVVDRKVKKVKEMEHPSVCSENALLSEKSFMTGETEPSIPNGYRLEWTNKVPKKEVPPHQEALAMISRIGEAAPARCRKVYAHAHDYNINSISTNSDGETFMSADDLRINLWNLEISDQCFNIIDMKPSNIEDLTEIITSAEFHPVYCNLLAYSSTRGFIRLVDMRQSALCDQPARILHDHEGHGSRSIFTEIIASISDMKFAREGRHILSRDYMNIKLWDLHMEGSPVATFKIHEYLRPKLSDLYNNDAIFDKFECCVSGDGLHFASGSYSNLFRIFSLGAGSKEGITLEASKNPNRKQLPQTVKATRLLRSFTRGQSQTGHDGSSSDSNSFPCDLNSKLLHMAWHPTTNLIACAAGNSLYLHHA
ncbi:serine/threonine protein phosphatase 2A 55 kDa regulatory subunit B beta isoform-like [Magnolia sinica]|uniref:serine/threonine protein phosphatase 2A 55 kDa regulatory subunit B beta isoform-like n=1 Tax=Magnolia sinica TaxID=86752 RepID=UPI00265A7CE9|nr:serine/threonine protein phosphatase 2A 55 kDa regulatory subunit B beta isoform-like [Magnolia sinica]